MTSEQIHIGNMSHETAIGILKLMLEAMETYDGISPTPARINAIKMAIEALEKEPRWIPVKERLPEVYEVVMTTRHGVVYPETRLTEDGWEWLYESGVDYWQETDDIEAWMPLPEPYKAETEE